MEAEECCSLAAGPGKIVVGQRSEGEVRERLGRECGWMGQGGVRREWIQ